MCTKNYILLNRNLLINDLWNSEPFTRGQAWVDLLLNTNWKDSIAIVKGIDIPVKRGQACRSVKQLAIRWKWSEGKVKRFLDLLVSLDQISYQTWGKNGAVNGAVKTGVTTLISIINYDTYQINGAEDGAQTERRRSADGAQTETYKKVKKEKNKTSSALERRRQEGFEELYNDYPRKEGKKEALRHYNASVKTLEDMVKIDLALAEYQKLVKGKERQYIKQASSWFNNWQDYVPGDWEPAYQEAKAAWEAENEDNEREEDGPGADD